MSLSYELDQYRFVVRGEGGRTLLRINCQDMPNCCGMIELGILTLHGNPTARERKEILDKFYEWIHTADFRDEHDCEDDDGDTVTRYRVGCILVTVISDQSEFIELFEAAGFKKIVEWNNPNTTNDLITYQFVHEDSRL